MQPVCDVLRLHLSIAVNDSRKQVVLLHERLNLALPLVVSGDDGAQSRVASADKTSKNRPPSGDTLWLQSCSQAIPYVLEVLILLRSEEHTSELQSRFDLVCR